MRMLIHPVSLLSRLVFRISVHDPASKMREMMLELVSYLLRDVMTFCQGCIRRNCNIDFNVQFVTYPPCPHAPHIFNRLDMARNMIDVLKNMRIDPIQHQCKYFFPGLPDNKEDGNSYKQPHQRVCGREPEIYSKSSHQNGET